ncbi:DoxX family protein [Pontibacter vulgaris]|uniref:DoxX family protein n=1 Tax=Pontibacter vulgaris TaxID=2905679 RepID=UPI0021D42931|nr:DoxX family protein [Pontibacter vulgaris]
MALLRSRYNYRPLGLLLLRLGIGFMFILHGWPKLAGGPEKWAQIGSSMEMFGVSFAPVFWGFMAGFAEAVGGFLLMIGLFFRPVCVLLFITMAVATTSHALSGDGFGGYSHAAEAAILFFSLIFIGPGKYSLDNALFPNKKDRNRYF